MMSSRSFFCCVLILAINGLNSRERYTMNFNWLFHIGSQDIQHATCTSASFKEQSHIVCQGLIAMDSVPKDDANACANACCANPSCTLFQINSGVCSIGDDISIYNPFSWVSTCKTDGQSTLYSRSGPDTNPDHFSAVSKNYDDSSWQTITIPHDYIVNGTVNANANPQDPRAGSHGYLPKNTSWYRKHFSLPQEYQTNTTLFIDFDGIFRAAVVFINGHFLGNHSSGYTSFRYYLDPVKDELEFGANSDNVLSIFVDATADEGWWYEGGGIYRNVWFNKANKIYFEPWGIYLPATVSNVNSDGVHGTGNLIINATINNKYDIDYNINVKFDIINPDGSILKTLTQNILMKANSNITIAPSYNGANIELWSLEQRALYTVNCTIYDATNQEIDFMSLRYGYRKVVFDINKGLFLNDKSVKMNGFCNHQDFGGAGVATPERINRFRIQHLKNMGANSWRMSHNPPNPELLDFADEYGFLIWDENRHFGINQQWFKDQKDLILRDRNHPSIIIWSICNEAGCQQNDNEQVGTITTMFKDIIHKYDGIFNNSNNWGYNRAISAAMSGGWGNYMSPLLDIQGINYNYQELNKYHKANPNQAIISSESCSCVTDRNEYKEDPSTGHCSAYDGCPWQPGVCPASCWTPIVQDYVIGSLSWTGFDYKGEPDPYIWPDINSHFGVNDMVGFMKDGAHYYKSVWTDINDEIVMHILPNTWNGDTKTDPLQIRVYTNCEYVELFINNKSITNGSQKIDPNEYFSISYSWIEGEISCNCLDVNNKILATKILQTTNEAYAILLEWEYPYNDESINNNTIIGDGQDVALINVFVVDNQNRIVPNSTNTIYFSVSDETIAFINGVGNGDPSCHERDKSSFRSVYHGKARILIQSMLNKSGKVKLTAKSDGLVSGNIDINVQLPAQEIITI